MYSTETVVIDFQFTARDTTPKRAYDRDFMLRLQHTGNTPQPEVVDTLQKYLLTKGIPLTPKKTPYKSPLASPSKVYVLKTPAKDGEPVREITREVPTTPSKLVGSPPQTPVSKTPGRTAVAPLAGNRVPFGAVKGPRATPSRPVANSSLPASKENVENRTIVNAVGPIKLALTTPVAPVEKKNKIASPADPESAKKGDKETDEHRLAQRQKQIEYGKRTVGYQRFISEVPRDKRKPGDPVTPRKNQKCSKRSWDGQVRKWRRELHKWDPTDELEIARWTAVIKEKYGDIDEEDDLDLSPPVLHQAMNALFISEDLQSVTKTLVF